MKQLSLKLFLFSLLFAVLLLPTIQKQFNFIQEKDLYGETLQTTNETFTKAGWFDGSFQERVNLNTEKSIGLRSTLIRIYNQLDYSLFNTTNADAVPGKDEYLFQVKYLDAYTGKDFIGSKKINQQVKDVKSVIEKLNEKGVRVVLAFAPSKVRLYPEYIPGFYARRHTPFTNYETYKKVLADQGVPYIDFIDYFRRIKDTTTYPLYPKQGIHWSEYGMYLVMDSVVNYLRGNLKIDLNHLYCDSITTSAELRYSDYDLGELSNVLFRMPHGEMPYPVFRFENNPARTKPNVLVIGDSYYWNVIQSGIPQNLFSGSNFWFYNHDVYADSIPDKGIIDLNNYMDIIEKQDVVIIIQTEMNMSTFGFGFFETTKDMMEGKSNRLVELESEIRNNPEWMALIKKKAAETNMDIDARIRADAEWILKEEHLKKKASPIEEMEKKIRSNPEWLSAVRKKAAEKNMDVDAMIRADAEWMVKEDSINNR